MCIGYFPGKKIKCLETRFSVLQKSICICTYEIFHVSPRKKAVSAEIVLIFSLFIISTFIINQVLLFSTCI